MYLRKKKELLLKQCTKIFQKKFDQIPQEIATKIQHTLEGLKKALLEKNHKQIKFFAKELESFSKTYLKKSFLDYAQELASTFIFALCIAILVRQSAFELYEIPSGSMRPTFKEKDRLLVSKTQFGLNIPLKTSHFLFDQTLVKRMGIVTFTGENMDIPNVKTLYFYLFPGYKQYVKRVIGLPGDTLYFYGGQVYGIDKQGNEITSQLQKKSLSHLEHIPFIHLDGKFIAPSMSKKESSSVTIRQMNIPLAKLYLSTNKEVHYHFLAPPLAEKSFDLHHLWGMGNYASARILKKEHLPSSHLNHDYYLELHHHPSVIKAKPGIDPYFRFRPLLHKERSYIPLSEKHLKAIWNNLYTGRFVIEKGYMRRYATAKEKTPYAPKLADIEDGIYEFYQGVLYQVKRQGITVEVQKDHPFYTFDVEKCLTFFNIGIECDTRFYPTDKDPLILPSRYAFFREGALYLMGAPILSKEDPTLQQYLSNELEKRAVSSNYSPFIDKGPPLKKNGDLDIDFIKTYGLKVPNRHYLVLGDNHAMSSDSRDFGFVPQENIKGAPTFMFWAPGGRYGSIGSDTYPRYTLPRSIVWALFLFSFTTYKYFSKRRLKNLSLHPT